MGTQDNGLAGDQTWEHIAAECWHLHQSGAFAAAYDLLNRARSIVPTPFVYWMLRLSVAMNISTELALRTLEEAIGEGHWFDEQLLRAAEAFLPLVALPAFEEFMITNNGLRAGPDHRTAGTFDRAT